MDSAVKKKLLNAAIDIRVGALTCVNSAKSGHPGGSFSIADVLAYLYFHEMNIDPREPDKPDRDRFVLSKGHTAPALYAALAHRGFFEVSELFSFRQTDSMLQGHPDMKGVPGVDMTTGSLGLGFSASCGMAKAAKVYDMPYRVYTALGDGELEEGQVWEAAMFAAHYKLDNLTAFIDLNGLQIDGSIADVLSPLPVDKKFEAFGWKVCVINGHDFDEIDAAVKAAKAEKGRPTAVICNTVKGKGVSFMENDYKWHGAAPSDEQFKEAISQLKSAYSI